MRPATDAGRLCAKLAAEHRKHGTEFVGGVYDEDYFERGVATGKSCYEDYRWLPELTLPLAEAITRFAGVARGARVLDFGCAKGFLVRALREQGHNALGVDVSLYALRAADPIAKPWLARCDLQNPVPFGGRFELIVAKDVLEHIEREALAGVLAAFRVALGGRGRLFVAVPLATSSGGAYVLPESERDPTHVIREDLRGWRRILTDAGFCVLIGAHHVAGIVERHTEVSDCVGFFLAEVA